MRDPSANMKFSNLAGRDRARGFTLIELMIAVTVVGILTAMALPTMKSATQNNRVKSLSSDMHISLMLARSEAIKRGADVELSGTSGGWEVTTASLTDPLQDNIMNPAITMTCDITGNANADDCMDEITFDRSGHASCFLPSSTTRCTKIELRFFYSDNDKVQMRCVALSLSGRPSILLDRDGNTANGCQS